jgi:hypothetical protein
MGYFRKKPVVVEAWRNIKDAKPPRWVADASQESRDGNGARFVGSLQGAMCVEVGDWIIKDPKNELLVHPVQDAIFVETYEQVSGPDA